MTQTKIIVFGDDDNLICQKVIHSLKDSPEYVIVYVNGKDVLDEEVSAAISNELEDLGIISRERNFSTGVYDEDEVLSLNVSEPLSDLQRRFLDKVYKSGFKIYNDFVDIPDDVSDNKQIDRKHNKPFYQKGRW